MIKDSIKNIEKLSQYGGNFIKAVEFIKALDFSSLLPQRYEIDGSNVYAFFAR